MARIKINLKDGSIKRTGKVLGIDLGTTNSLVAVVSDDTRQPYCLGDGNPIMPSVIHIGEDHNIQVGNEALPFLLSNPESTVYSVKRLLGRSYTDIASHASGFGYRLLPDETRAMVQIKIHDRIYNPIELSSFILKALKNKAEVALGTSLGKAVITVPAYFNDAQRQATRDAGKLAGLEVLRIVNEPTAASLAYGIGLHKDDQKTIAVYDLGGGTFDITLLQIQNGVFEVLSTHGDTYTGGDDFDRAIAAYWCESAGIVQQEFEKNKPAYQALRIKAELAKKHLTSSEEFQDQIILGEKTIPLFLDRNTFENLVKPFIDKTIASCTLALKDAGLKVTDIDEIVMVGGSTRTPYVNERIKLFFSKDRLNNSLDPDQVVALGAAIEADILAGNRKDIVLLDVTPLSLGIETMGGLMDVIIPRNNKIPVQAARQYTTSLDGQSKLKISVFQGERELCMDNRKLGEFTLGNIPSMPAGLPKIEIRFLLNADGILNVEAEELRSGIRQEIQIKPQYGLSDKEVENMLLSAMQNAESDMFSRMLTELKTEAAQVVYQCRKMLANHSGMLNSIEIAESENAVKELEKVCEGKEKEAINSAMERLNRITRPFAERIMDEAIGKALTGKKFDSL